MKPLASAAMLVAVLIANSIAYAHHPSPAPHREYSATEKAANSVSLDLSTTSFDLNDTTGSFYTLAIAGEAWWHRYGIRLRVPWHTLQLGTNDPVNGIGDVQMTANYRIPDIGRFLSTASLGVYIPIGDAELGLSQGSIAIAPALSGGFEVAPDVSLFGATAAIFNTYQRNALSYVEQRADIETRVGFGAAWTGSVVRTSGEVTATVPLAPESIAGTIFVSFAPAVSVKLYENLWLRANAEIPLTSERQFDWRAGAAIAYQFNQPSGQHSVIGER